MSDNKPSKRRRRKGKQPDPLLTAPLDQILTELCIHSWDVLIIGDGSGCSWNRGCGWASVLVDHYLNRRKTFNGAMNAGTVNVAEVLPYVQALAWYSRGPGKDRLHRRLTSGDVDGRHLLHVHIITDSEIVANQGNGLVRRRASEEWWAALDCIAAKGYQLHWHWVSRDRLGLNMLTDHLSRCSRMAVESIELPPGTSVYDFNPSPDGGMAK